MKTIIITVVAAAALTATGLTASEAAAPSGPQTRVICFTGEDATCTPVAQDGAVLDVGVGPEGYAGVYINSKRQNGKTLDRVDSSFDWSGALSGGSPRFSIPIDEDGDGATEAYAFLDPINCGTVAGAGHVSTEDPNCLVFYDGAYRGNWDTFAATNPTYRVSEDIPFVIADQPGQVTISNVRFAVS